MKARKQVKNPRPRKLTRAEVLQGIDDIVNEVRQHVDEIAAKQRSQVENGFDAIAWHEVQQAYDKAVASLHDLAMKVQYRGESQ